MKLAVIGTGYVGLVAGTCFAEVGNDVTCIDINKEKITALQHGKLPIYEPGIAELLGRNCYERRLHFTTNLEQGITDATIIFLALPTPASEDGSADLSYILGVADQLGPLLKHYTVIVDKSTVPVGTAAQVRARIATHTRVEFDVVSNPEFLREGLAIADFLRPNRIIIGSSSPKARDIMQALYAPFTTENSPLYMMDELSAEMTKYAANSFLATKVSFINEIANLCEKVGADVEQVRLGMGADERIGHKFLHAGIGYGGSCFPKDIKALNKVAIDHGYDFKIAQAVYEVNALQRIKFADTIIKYYADGVRDKTFAVWGLAFKPDTDDVREAPALDIISRLAQAGATIVAFDPEAMPSAKRVLGHNDQVRFAESAYACLSGADALIIATEWEEFRSPDFSFIRQSLKHPVIFDGRNIHSSEIMAKLGFTYISVGRHPVIV